MQLCDLGVTFDLGCARMISIKILPLPTGIIFVIVCLSVYLYVCFLEVLYKYHPLNFYTDLDHCLVTKTICIFPINNYCLPCLRHISPITKISGLLQLIVMCTFITQPLL